MQEGSDNNKIMAILCYIGILWIVPLLTDAKDDMFVKFHINQGIVLTIAGVIVSIFTAIPILGWIIGPILWLVLIIFAVMGIITASKLETKELPIIGKMQVYK